MPSDRHGTPAYKRTPDVQLKKGSIRAGFILWLRSNVDENELQRLTVPRLEAKALDHPVVVIDLLEGSPSDVQICIVWRP
jgi:hypothetical protein